MKSFVLFFFFSNALAIWPMPRHKMMAVFNAHPPFDSFVDTLAQHPGSVNYAALYSYTIGAINASWHLPAGEPFGINFTLALQNLSRSTPATPTYVTPVIQMGGANAENNFGYATLWTQQFVAEGQRFKYDGYVLDCQISHTAKGPTQNAFKAFLDVFAGGLHAVNMSLQLVTRFDFPKVSYRTRTVCAPLTTSSSQRSLTLD